MESFEYIGEWWLPGKCNEKRYGKLTFAPNDWAKLEITIEGQDDNDFALEASPLQPIPILLGTMNATAVTLCHCSLADYPFAMSGQYLTRKRIFLVSTVFVGAHFETVDDIVLDELSLGYTHLDEWMGHLNFEVKAPNTDYGFDVTYSPFNPIHAVVQDFEISFGYRGCFPPWFERTSWISFRDQAQITLKPKSGEAISFWEYLPLVNFFLPTMLTMATGNYNYPLNVTGVPTDEDAQGLSICFPIPGYLDKAKNLTRWDMLFRFEDLEKNGLLGERLSTWIDRSKTLRTVLDLYFRFYYQKDLDAETKFLYIAQMMEAYQRTMYGGKYPTQHSYKRVVGALEAAIPPWVEEPLRKNLKAMIGNGNKFSFNSRIKYMLETILCDHHWMIRSIVGNFDDFATRVVATRNNLTHRSQTPSESVIMKSELPKYVANMETILRLCFLVEIGFSTDEIKYLWSEYLAKPNFY